ncbi:MAG: hypothetical protein QOG62_1689 [Thermoleophilaceae bacterium]|jgi:hypothetical protein|nr:hypothetical protein [Thermoleophilaceae bacterium]
MPLIAVDPPSLDAFYTGLSQASFVLLGLWWVVVQLKYAEGSGDVSRRRHVYGVMLFLLIPGVMSVTSLVNSDLTLLWRVAFGISGAAGLLECLFYFGTSGVRTRGSTVLRVFAALLCGLIVLIALFPDLSATIGFGLSPREVEAILSSLLLVVGAHMVYFALTESSETAGA